MKKKAKLVIFLPLALVVFLGAFWWNFPWERSLQWGLTSAQNVAAEKGVSFSCASSSADDRVSPLFMCGGLKVRHALGGLELARADARFHPLSSVLSRGVLLDVKLGPGRFQTMTGQELGWTEGTCSLLIRRETVFIQDLALSGDLTAKGYIEVSASKGRIVKAAVELTTPGEVESMMQALSAILPLKRVKAGEWRLERK